MNLLKKKTEYLIKTKEEILKINKSIKKFRRILNAIKGALIISVLIGGVIGAPHIVLPIIATIASYYGFKFLKGKYDLKSKKSQESINEINDDLEKEVNINKNKKKDDEIINGDKKIDDKKSEVKIVDKINDSILENDKKNIKFNSEIIDELKSLALEDEKFSSYYLKKKINNLKNKIKLKLNSSLYNFQKDYLDLFSNNKEAKEIKNKILNKIKEFEENLKNLGSEKTNENNVDLDINSKINNFDEFFKSEFENLKKLNDKESLKLKKKERILNILNEIKHYAVIAGLLGLVGFAPHMFIFILSTFIGKFCYQFGANLTNKIDFEKSLK